MITILIRDIFLFTDFSNHAVHYAHINQLFKPRSTRRVIPAHNHKREIDHNIPQRFQYAITTIKDRDR